MSKFNNKGKAEMPELNTSSLPDLIFSILFFFMIVTSMREEELKVEFKAPSGTELSKIERKTAAINLYIGTPNKNHQKQLGSGTRVQINDKFIEVYEVGKHVAEEHNTMKGDDKAQMRVVLKVDAGDGAEGRRRPSTQMGVVSDVKEELREIGALAIMYSAEYDVKRNEQ
jgi:biopolymer transport protein ExbD